MVAVREALTRSGLDAKCYAGHSFRIGAATTATQQGLQDSLIEMLGRWESSVYTRYQNRGPGLVPLATMYASIACTGQRLLSVCPM